MNYSDSRNYPSLKSEVMHETNSLEKPPIQHMSGWPHWSGIRLQTSDGCCWEFTSHWRQLFFLEFIYLTEILLDLLIVKNPNGCGSVAQFPMRRVKERGVPKIWEFCPSNKVGGVCCIMKSVLSLRKGPPSSP